MKISNLILLALFPTVAHAEAAHTHGAARLTLTQDGASVEIELASPLHNVVGFEHVPGNAAQRAALDTAADALRQRDNTVVLPTAAQCSLEGAALEMPFDEHAHDEHATAPAHDAAAPVEGEHADLRAVYRFSCAHPEALTEATVTAFETFPRMNRIVAEAATDGGAGSAVLHRDQPVWALPTR